MEGVCVICYCIYFARNFLFLFFARKFDESKWIESIGARFVVRSRTGEIYVSLLLSRILQAPVPNLGGWHAINGAEYMKELCVFFWGVAPAQLLDNFIGRVLGSVFPDICLLVLGFFFKDKMIFSCLLKTLSAQNLYMIKPFNSPAQRGRVLWAPTLTERLLIINSFWFLRVNFP